MDDLERRLQLGVVMYVGRARPPISCEDAAEAIVAQLSIPRFRFSVHKFHPEDFLVIFAAHQFRNMALAVPSIEHQGVKLFIKPWLRQAHATSRLMRVQVDITIEGVPSHVWSQRTTAEILGSACLIDSLAPETVSGEDLSLFKLRAWCVDPGEVLVFHRLWVPEPAEIVHDPTAQRPSFRQLLEYPILVHIGRMHDFFLPELWRGRSGSNDRSGQSGLPDSSLGSDARGAGHDQRSPASGGAGGGMGRSYQAVLQGRVGPSDWRLSHMGTGQRAGVVGQGGSFATTTEGIPKFSNASRAQPGTLANRRATPGDRAVSDPLAKCNTPVSCYSNTLIDAQQLVVEGHEQRSSNGWAPVADLLQITMDGQPMREADVFPTLIPVAMQLDMEGEGIIGDMTMYTACTGLELIGMDHGPSNVGLEMDSMEASLSNKEQLALSNIKTFCACLLKKLGPPFLKEFEELRGVKPGQDPFTPRHTTRSLGVGGPRKSKASAAETVLLKTLGLDCEDLAVSEEVLGQLRQVFNSPLREQQLRAIAAIFGKAIPFNMGGEMERTELAVV
ncbi:hypothetical protein VPH35_103256 [Triticum aestivum]